MQYENARLEPGWSTEQLETIDVGTDLYVPMYPSPAKLELYAQRHELDPRALPLVSLEGEGVLLSSDWRDSRGHVFSGTQPYSAVFRCTHTMYSRSSPASYSLKTRHESCVPAL